jgi:hypothetical protein
MGEGKGRRGGGEEGGKKTSKTVVFKGDIGRAHLKNTMPAHIHQWQFSTFLQSMVKRLP